MADGDRERITLRTTGHRDLDAVIAWGNVPPGAIGLITVVPEREPAAAGMATAEVLRRAYGLTPGGYGDRP